MLTIIYPHRNRDLKRIERSLRSLQEQTVKDFKVCFIDYGSHKALAKEIEQFLQRYEFVKFQHYQTYYQPWNKCRALNSVIKNLEPGFCFVADIDMIFHKDFVKTAISLQDEEKAIYFQVGFLNEDETKKDKLFNEYSIDFKSTYEATGLTLFPVKALRKIKGFDEFYHFWGAEDTDVHVRLKNAGFEVDFYDDKILMLHQWHQSYRSKETRELTEDLRLTNIVKLNHQHLMYSEQNNVTITNKDGWGNPLSQEAFKQLESFNGKPKTLDTNKEVINHFLFCELPMVNNKINEFIICFDKTSISTRYHTKRFLGKPVPIFYSIKEINDMLLTHIISFYRNYEYNLKVNTSRKEINLRIRKPKTLK